MTSMAITRLQPESPAIQARQFRIVEVRMTDGPGEMAYTPNRLEVKKGEQIKFVREECRHGRS